MKRETLPKYNSISNSNFVIQLETMMVCVKFFSKLRISCPIQHSIFFTLSPATARYSLVTTMMAQRSLVCTQRHHRGYYRKLFIKLPIAYEWAIYMLIELTDNRASSRNSVLFSPFSPLLVTFLYFFFDVEDTPL